MISQENVESWKSNDGRRQTEIEDLVGKMKSMDDCLSNEIETLKIENDMLTKENRKMIDSLRAMRFANAALKVNRICACDSMRCLSGGSNQT